MLYDQAQLAAVYAEAYLVTKDESLARVVREIFDYVEECLSDPSGGFYSAEDADSYPSSDVKEKKEGAFYVWTFDEVQSLLGKITAGDGQNFSLADVVCHHFDIRPSGNVEPYQVGQFSFQLGGRDGPSLAIVPKRRTLKFLFGCVEEMEKVGRRAKKGKINGNVPERADVSDLFGRSRKLRNYSVGGRGVNCGAAE